MKKIMSLEELESLKVEKFKEIDKIDSRIKKIMSVLENLSIDYEKFEKEYKPLKQLNDKISHDYLQAYTLGEGIYAEQILKPEKIKLRLKELKENVYDKYTGKISEPNRKEYELRRKVLEEDLIIAQENVKAIEEEYRKSNLETLNYQKKLESCGKEIHEYNKILSDCYKVRRRLFQEIKKIDNAIIKDKKIYVKK